VDFRLSLNEAARYSDCSIPRWWGGVAIGDYDGDGPDLSRVGGGRQLYRNLGVRFTNVTEHAGVRLTAWTPGGVWDLNGDGIGPARPLL
jgi:hypothetical protein